MLDSLLFFCGLQHVQSPADPRAACSMSSLLQIHVRPAVCSVSCRCTCGLQYAQSPADARAVCSLSSLLQIYVRPAVCPVSYRSTCGLQYVKSPADPRVFITLIMLMCCCCCCCCCRVQTPGWPHAVANCRTNVPSLTRRSTKSWGSEQAQKISSSEYICVAYPCSC
jgi:hypothetical protein